MKKIKKKLILGFIVIFLAPVTVNYLCILGNRVFNCSWWKPEYALGYVGSIITSIFTLYGVFLSINFTKSSQAEERKYAESIKHEERKLIIKPYLQTSYDFCCSYEFLCKKTDNSAYYIIINSNTKKINKYPSAICTNMKYYENINNKELLENCDISTLEKIADNMYIPDLPKKSLETNSNEEYKALLINEVLNKSNKIIQTNHKEMCFMYYKLQNVGAGSAISIKFAIGEDVIIPCFALPPLGEREFIIQFEKDILNDANKTIKINFEFSDILGLGTYYQSESFYLSKDIENSLKIDILKDRLLTKPIELKSNRIISDRLITK